MATFGEEQLQCPCLSDPFMRGRGCWWSRGIWTHFINCAQSDIFKGKPPMGVLFIHGALSMWNYVFLIF